MELLYAYAEKYRIFEHQEFSFSERFRIHFDQKNRKLTIERNENYFDRYPGNILGISAVVGKNAAGKTSLLSMLGDREERRDLTEGLDANAPERYFLIHWLGHEDETDSFLLETNEFAAFRDLFEGNTPEEKDDLSCCDGSVSCRFQRMGDGMLRCMRMYSYGNEDYPVRMLFFRNDAGEQSRYMDSFGRREAPLVLNARYQEVEMLRNQIRANTGRESMFGNGNYHYHVRFAVVKNSRQGPPLQRELSKILGRISPVSKVMMPEFLVLGIVVREQIRLIENSQSKMVPNKKLDSTRKWLTWMANEVQHMESIQALHYLYDTLSAFEYEDMRLPYKLHIWEQLRNKYYIQNIIQKIIELMHSPDIHAITTETKDKLVLSLDLWIGADTDISILASFWDEVESLEIFGGYIHTEISPLSDGERENLAMYSSIHAQLVDEYIDSGSCILLFDEIERCMHPEMCRCLISDLMEFLRGYPDKQFQIIIASHSPFIIGDLRQENLICLTKDGKVYQPEERPFGQNIHTLLKSQFFLDNTFSKYACDMITLVAECLSSRDKDGTIRWNSLEEMRKMIREKLGTREQYPDKRLPSDDTDTLPFLEQIIDSVGEPLLRRTLQGKLEQWKEHDASLNWKQAEREALLKRLRELDEQLGDR